MSTTDAKDLYIKAEKKLSSYSWFSSGNKYEDAAELFTNAANKYKYDKFMNEAGEAFLRAADCYMKANEKEQAVINFANAGNAYKKANPEAAIHPLVMAMNILAEKGRFHTAAKHAKDLGEIYEEQLTDQLDKCIGYYQRAADWYQGEDSTATANVCLLKLAQAAATMEKYDLAIEKFEEIAKSSLNSSLTRYSVKDYLFKAILCHLCMNDVRDVKNTLAKYESLDASFTSTRECRFLHDIIDDMENDDVESFTDHVTDFDNLLKLDNWKATILLRIKNKIEEEPSLT